jgi:(p)ppGpp synthase/HD superfamily hydrolase
MTGLVEKARSYAIAVHGAAAQTYSGIYPYTYHLLQVYKLTKSYAKKLNFTEEETTVACSIAWLHDTIEDARITYGDLTSNKFPNIIAEGVRALTQNPRGRTRAERADAEYYNNIVIHKIFLLVKLCDTMANASFSESVGSKMYLKYREEIPKTIDTYNLETIYNNQLSDIVKQLKNI